MSQSSRPHVARKRFGQHFLTDQRVLTNIVNVFAPRNGQNLVEIGPGLGALTHPLLDRVERLTVIELDRDLAARLQQRYPPERLTVCQMDVLDADLSTIERVDPEKKLRLIGNLPYNISTPLIFHLLAQRHQIEDMVFMVQREVAMRLAASPGSKQYGRLSVMTSLSLQTECLFDVPPTAFEPPPKVDSTVIRLVPREESVAPEQLAVISKVVAAAFQQRRKTLRNALSGLVTDAMFDEADVLPSLRAEALAPAAFIALAAAVEKQPGEAG